MEYIGLWSNTEYTGWEIIEDIEDSLFPYSQEIAWEDLFALDEVQGGYLEAVNFFYVK